MGFLARRILFGLGLCWALSFFRGLRFLLVAICSCCCFYCGPSPLGEWLRPCSPLYSPALYRLTPSRFKLKDERNRSKLSVSSELFAGFGWPVGRRGSPSVWVFRQDLSVPLPWVVFVRRQKSSISLDASMFPLTKPAFQPTALLLF